MSAELNWQCACKLVTLGYSVSDLQQSSTIVHYNGSNPCQYTIPNWGWLHGRIIPIIYANTPNMMYAKLVTLVSPRLGAPSSSLRNSYYTKHTHTHIHRRHGSMANSVQRYALACTSIIYFRWFLSCKSCTHLVWVSVCENQVSGGGHEVVACAELVK